MPLKSSFLGTA